MYKFITTVFTTSMVGGSIFYLMEKIKNRKYQHNDTYMYHNPIVQAIPGFIWGGYTGVVLYSLSKIRIPEVVSNYMIKK